MRSLPGLLAALASLCALGATAQTTFYVDAARANSGDGSSWAAAFRYLDEALEAADDGDQVWVAAGTYTPGAAAPDRDASYEFDDDIAIYGGFAGTETDPAQRDLAANLTVLTGDVLGDDLAEEFETNVGDNVRHLMEISAENTAATVLDGLTFTRGIADAVPGAEAEDAGGALLCYGAATIRNCRFRENFARRGGAVYVEEDAASGLSLRDCSFVGNLAERGGAFYGAEFEALRLSGSVFDANEATEDGGAVYLDDADEFVATDCVFDDNEAGGIAGALWCGDADGSVVGGTFSDNSAEVGGAFAATDESVVAFASSSFVENESVISGGAVYLEEAAAATFEDCSLADNATDGNGGALHIRGGSLPGDTSTFATLLDCTVSANVAGASGGALWAQFGAEVSVEASTLTGNRAGENGGVAVIGPDPLDLGNTYVERSRVADNVADSSGGAFALLNGELELVNALLVRNAAGRYGGSVVAVATDTFNAELLAVNSTFYRNAAAAGGDELAVDLDDDAEVEAEFLNNLFDVEDSFFEAARGEADFESLGGNILTDDTDEPIFTDGTDRLDVSSVGLFVDAAADDFRLAPGSVAVDAGVVAEDTPEDDLAGELRDDRPDSGAYEYTGTVGTRSVAAAQEGLLALPTVTAGEVRIRLAGFPSAPASTLLTLRVLDATGADALPQSSCTAGAGATLDLSGLPAGCYVVQLVGGRRTLTTRVIRR